ncbi:single-stranded DNA-binding protein [Saccharopolyspora gloriosae]|uniref:single-stranded DNA-binding protein n=1 Tax=Saccharopolyspora gloriosae TaxID=455344 RepID=UPI001FB629A2|nr:single-stranded DNA-binding protein [Saccharopolyspora gloriosae]
MQGLPEVSVAGTLTADPELKFVPSSGDAVVNFTIAANDRKFDRDAQKWVDGDVTFLRCSLWRQAAENVSESLTKGDRVVVVGALKQRSWQTDQGDKRSVVELAVSEIGPSLRWATAKPTKVKRSAPAAPAATVPGEPPF